MPQPRHEAPAITLLIASLAPIVWGTTYFVTTEWLPNDRPLLAALMRALPAGILLLVLLRKLPTGDWWWRATVLGVLNIGIFFALLFESAYRLPGGVAAVLGAVQPLVIVGLSIWMLRTPARVGQVVAGIAGVGGIALMVLKANAAIDMVGVVAGLIGVVSMCVGFVLTKKWAPPVGPLVMTSWQLVAGGLFLLPIALIGEGMPPALSLTNVVGYAYLGIVCTALAYYVWFRGINRLSPARTSFLTLLTPVVATFIGWLALDEVLSPLQTLGIVVALLSVVGGQYFAAPRVREELPAEVAPAPTA
ncbi:MAG: protein of unknown function transrane [Thermoleophilia bacterium]|nr:protein of unknown function transrane [Thermoleophilia bacterium]MCZ4496326.1 protein of unknown function transrane [Thermoleophilia bacterium]